LAIFLQCPSGLLATPQCSASAIENWASCLSAEAIGTSNVSLSFRGHPNTLESYDLFWREIRAGNTPSAWSKSPPVSLALKQ